MQISKQTWLLNFQVKSYSLAHSESVIVIGHRSYYLTTSINTEGQIQEEVEK